MTPRRYATGHMLIGQEQVHCQLLSIINCGKNILVLMLNKMNLPLFTGYPYSHRSSHGHIFILFKDHKPNVIPHLCRAH
jgi:hypothetical protein